MNQPLQLPSDQKLHVVLHRRPSYLLIALVILLMTMLALSVLMNLGQALVSVKTTGEETTVNEKFHSGDKDSSVKVARLVTDFTIMPPHTEKFLKAIDYAKETDDIKAVLLVIDSPGGLVSDSHEIYHKLLQLSEVKTVYVHMKGIAASGGYYIAMGAGKDCRISAEPTTWTGSIGVIVPRYDISELVSKVGIKPDSLATGPLKDTLNPMKEMSAQEKEVWEKILEDSFQRFLGVIEGSRPNMTKEQVRATATGQIYTAQQAKDLGLVDVIQYEDDVVKEIGEKLGKPVKVVNLSSPKSFGELLLGASASVRPEDPISRFINSSAPRPMYLFGWPQTAAQSQLGR